jgi:hypothetical protein
MLFCSCAIRPAPQPPRPAELPINDRAGRGDWLSVKLHLENGKEFKVMVDTGGQRTVLDKSLEPFLGKCLGQGRWYEPMMGGLLKVNLYPAPKLYAGTTPLMTGSCICTYDLQKDSPGLQGIVGMDTLRNYCVQFDFVNRKMRFLDPDQTAGNNLGKPYPLIILFGLVIAYADFFNTGHIHFCPDTGCSIVDVIMQPRRLNREIKKQKPAWTGQGSTYLGASKRVVGFSSGRFGGNTYSNLVVEEWPGIWPGGNLIGLPFLARNLVTFNFPRRMMYLKQQNVQSPEWGSFLILEAANYLRILKKNEQLPGWNTNETGHAESPSLPEIFTNYPVALTFDLHKDGRPGWVDVTPEVKSLATNGEYEIPADNHLVGCDPAKNIKKQLSVTFRIHDRQKTVEVKEGKTLTLPTGAEVILAHYGKLDASAAYRHQQNDDNSIYHYTLAQASKTSSWKLKKAWQTDTEGQTIREYLIK